MSQARKVKKGGESSRQVSLEVLSPSSSVGTQESLAPHGVILFGILVLAVLIRLDFLLASDFVIDADEAIVGLMAKHVVEGASWPVFYYGQHYMGSLEPLLVAGLFSMVGVSALALKAVPLAFSLLLIVLVYRLGCSLGGRQVGQLAALFAALPPSALVVWSVKARGGFVELICIGALALLLTMKHCSGEQRKLSGYFGIGLVLGFGWWVNNQIIYFILPIGLALAVDRARQGSLLSRAVSKLVAFVTGCLGFILGGAPFWLYNLQNEFVSFEMFGGASSKDILGQIGTFFTGALPILFGARGFWQEVDLFSGSSALLLALYVPVIWVLASYLWSEAADFLLRGKVSPALLLVLFFFATASVFCLSSFGYLYKAPRYLLPLYVAIFPLTAFALVSLSKRFPAVSYLCVTGIVVLQLLSYFPGKRLIPGEPFVFKGERVSHDHSQLIEWLDDKGISWVRTNYWIGYRLAFETQERVRFLLFQKPYQDRISQYTEQGSKVDQTRVPYVLVSQQAKIVSRALDVLGMSYQTAMLSGYVVLYDISPPKNLGAPLPADVITPVASEASASAFAAIDGDRATRWGSGKPQHSEMVFTLSFPPKTFIDGIRSDLGQWIHDYPRALRIDAVLADGQTRTLLRRSDFRALRYLYEYEPLWMMYLEKSEIRQIHFYQVGSDPIFDWSIAEIEVFGEIKSD